VKTLFANSDRVLLDAVNLAHVRGSDCDRAAARAGRVMRNVSFVQAGVWGVGFCHSCWGLTNPWTGGRL
jgi:hypothetical protein